MYYRSLKNNIMKTKDTILTKEERDVLILAAPHPCGQRFSNTEIGQRLGISVTRVKTLVRNASIKLGARNRNEALFFAIRRGEIRPDDLYSLNELAEICSTFNPDIFRKIPHLVHKYLKYGKLEDEQIIRNRRPNMTLTSCERDVLILAGRGVTNKEIADTLYISLHAVSTFLYRACIKLGAHNRADAVVFALKRGEISIGDIYLLDEWIQALATLKAESIEKIAQLLTRESGQVPVPTVS